MKNRLHTISKAGFDDLPYVFSLYREVGEQLLSRGNPMWSGDYPSEDDLREDIGAGRLYLIREGKEILGAASISHDVTEAFFPRSHSYRKGDELLEKVGYRGEPIAILHRFAILPLYQHKGVGSEFLASLMARYRGSTWLFTVYEKNAEALLFYKKRGFSSLGLYPDIEAGEFSSQFVLYKTYKREGLCSTAWW